MTPEWERRRAAQRERGPVVHTLKTWTVGFQAIRDGRKTWEVRRDDRSPVFLPGDTLHLQEWDPDERRYTGREIEVTVTFVMPLQQFGAGPFVGMSIEPRAAGMRTTKGTEQ